LIELPGSGRVHGEGGLSASALGSTSAEHPKHAEFTLS